jgi:CheY-like chemotaxis protein
MKNNIDQAKIKANFKLAKILVVDDSDDHWRLIQKAIQQVLAEVTSERAASPAQALTLLEEWQYQEWEVPKQILLDLYMPEAEDGWGLLRQIKSMPAPISQVPIVMLSSSTSSADIMKAYELGVSSYLVKPNNFEDWLTYFQELRTYWWETVSLPLLQYKL